MSINNDNLNFSGNREEFAAVLDRGNAAFSDSTSAEGNLEGKKARVIDMPPTQDASTGQTSSLKRKKSVCEKARDVISGTLFSLGARCRNRKLSAKVQVKKLENIKKHKTEPVLAKDQALIKLFTRLPSNLQAEVDLNGSKSAQAEQIRTWLKGIQDDRLSKVKKLDLSLLRLQVIPDEICYFNGLTSLILSGTEIEDITPIQELRSLEELNLSLNSIKDIAPLTNLSNLTRLVLPCNRISEIPSLQALTKLTVISLDFNPIKPVNGIVELFPERVRQSVTRQLNKESYEAFLSAYQASPLLKRFIDPAVDLNADPKKKVLDVQNKVMKLLADSELSIPPTLDPSILEQAIKDRSLILLYRKITTTAPVLGTTAEQAQAVRNIMGDSGRRNTLSAVSALDLNDLNLITIPEEIKYLTGLTTLKLRGNGIEDITFIRELRELKVLDLGKNLIQNIDALSALVNLEELGLNQNQIQNIDALGTLVRLQILSLFENRIQNIVALGTLVNLQQLYLSQNQIQNIAALGTLVNLELLSLSQNQIQNIDALGTLVRLQILSLSQNQIQNIAALNVLVNLQAFDVYQNNIPLSSVNISTFPERVRISILSDLQVRSAPTA